MVYQINTSGLGDQAVTNEKIESGTITINSLSATLEGALVPIGGIIMWSGTADQINGFPNWQLCDGSSIISGTLSGSNTPDLVGRFILGTNTYDTVEERWEETITGGFTSTGGAATHILTIDEMPSHDHPFPPNSDASVDYYWKGQADATPDFTFNAGTTYELTTTAGVASQGGGQAHNNLPPYYSLAYIMRIV